MFDWTLDCVLNRPQNNVIIMFPVNNKTTLLITFDFPPKVGGIESLMYRILSHYPGKIVVLAPWHPDGEDFDKDHNFEVIRVKCPNSTLTRIPLFLFHGHRLLRREKVNHILSANIFSAIVSMILSQSYDIPFSLFGHGKEILVLDSNLRSKVYKKIFKTVLLKASRIISVSTYTAILIKNLGIPQGKISVVPPSFDFQLFDNFSEKKFKKFKDNLFDSHDFQNKKIILTVSRLVPRKGHDATLRAIALLAREVSNILYIIVGCGPEQQNLEDLTKNLNISNKVIFTGEVSNEQIVYYYNLSHIFVLANRIIKETADVEGFGQVFLEASYCGLPVIGGINGGAVDSIDHESSGYLVDPEDPQKIAEKIKALITDDQLRMEFGKTGKERVQKQFRPGLTADKIVAALEPHYL